MSVSDFRFIHTRAADGRPLAIRVDEQYVCDFCLGSEPRWQFPCGPVRIVGHPAISLSEDEWLACDECRRLIDQASVGALVERCVREERRNVPPGTMRNGEEAIYPPVPIARRIKRENIVAFMDARRGDARPFRP